MYRSLLRDKLLISNKIRGREKAKNIRPKFYYKTSVAADTDRN